MDNNPTNLTDPTGLGLLACLRWPKWYNKCATSSAECGKKLDAEYDMVQMCLKYNLNSPSAVKLQECIQKNPDCQKMMDLSVRCTSFSVPTGIIRAIRDLVGF